MPKKKDQYIERPKYFHKEGRGRPALHPPEDCKRLMTRSTVEEYQVWAAAAKKEGLTIGPWSRMILNRAARDLGIKVR